MYYPYFHFVYFLTSDSIIKSRVNNTTLVMFAYSSIKLYIALYICRDASLILKINFFGNDKVVLVDIYATLTHRAIG